MAVTESARHRLYQRLTEVVGPEEATTLMEYLPPVGWADVATKTDLEHGIDGLEVEMNAFRTEMNARFDVYQAKNEAAINRAMRINTLVTVSVLGVLMAVISAITSAA